MKGKFVFMVLMLISCVSIVNAEEKYFTNQNNVSLNEEEYKFISEMFYDGFQNIITINDYEIIFADKVNGYQKIKKNIIETVDNMRATYHETQSKQFTISASCDNTCLVTLVAKWKKNPNIRSYDVIGAYLENISLTSTPITYASNTIETNHSSEMVTDENGFGVSVKLPTGGEDMVVTQFFRVSKGGVVNGSYQHATANISLANSKKYTISYTGFGGVFLFNSSIRNYYDGMGGVNLNV